MTMPDERYRAMVEGMKLIQNLINPQATPKVPSNVREHARWVLRHYPSEYELLRLAERSPDMLLTKDFNGKEIK